jgi:hypothetical protein
MAQTFFALLIFQVRSCIFARGQTQTKILLRTTPSLLTEMGPRLASNHDPPDFHS